MSVARWLLPVVSLALVLLVTWRDFGGTQAGPGPLHPAHARALAAGDAGGCEACHEPGAGVAAARCAVCHEAITLQLAAGTGLHGSLSVELRERCEECHSDHHGAETSLLPPYAFARAGIADVDAYDHRHVAFALAGAHSGLACTRCHPGAADGEPPAGGRFLGKSQRCTSCHEDRHEGVYGTDCAGCHGQEQEWSAAPGFAHAAFALAGAHARLGCVRCHDAEGPHAVTALRVAPQPARDCAACHDDPHGGAGRPPGALRLANAADCRRCHDAVAFANARPSAERHAAFGFALRGAHAAADCAGCHGDVERAQLWSAVPPRVEDCAACHAHPHGAPLLAAARSRGGSECATCHRDADQAFAAAAMPPALHAATGFPLHEPHAGVACAGCHVGEARADRFPGRAAADCRGCHRDPHGGQFDGAPRHEQCTACHLPTAFVPPRFGIAAHAESAFPLTGAHDAVACARCHHEESAGIRRFRGTARECRSCHADTHGGAFDRAGLPLTVAGRTDCARCHDTDAFQPVGAAFDHALWTGYELVGGHAAADCAGCHPRTAAGVGGLQRRLGPAVGTRCADCHRDPHAGQFAADGATDCRRCHEAVAFRIVAFDHGATRFPLDAVHEPLPCSACHKSYATGNGGIVRYRPLGTTCGECHQLGVPKGGRR